MHVEPKKNNVNIGFGDYNLIMIFSNMYYL